MSDAIRIATTVTPLESPISKTHSNPEAGRNPQDRRPSKRKSKLASELHNELKNDLKSELKNEFVDLQEREEHQLDVLI